MTKQSSLQIFEEKKVRTVWDDKEEQWYFAVVDVVEVLTDSKDSAAYWRKLKQRLKAEGNETVTICHGLKKEIGQSVVSPMNAKQIAQSDTPLITDTPPDEER